MRFLFSLFSLAKSKRLFLFFLSFVIVAWGHPDVSPVLTVCSYAFGLALFWIFLFSLSEKKQRFWMSLFWFALVQGVQLSWLATPEYQGIYIYLSI